MAYSEPSQTSKIGVFPEIVNGFQLLTIFISISSLDVWLGSKCDSIEASLAFF